MRLLIFLVGVVIAAAVYVWLTTQDESSPDVYPDIEPANWPVVHWTHGETTPAPVWNGHITVSHN